MAYYFPHEKLEVYGVALRFASLTDIEQVKSYLREVMAMLSGLRGYLDE
jgi:hypothetical protein